MTAPASGQGADSRLDPAVFAQELADAGLDVLCVSRHRHLRDVLVIYLRTGPDQVPAGEARLRVADHPAIHTVTESVPDRMVLLARLRAPRLVLGC